MDLKISLKITREGFRLVLATMLVGLASLNTGNNLMYLILSVMLSILGLSILITFLNLEKITVDIKPLEEFFVGKSARAEIMFKNKKRFFPSFSIVLTTTPDSPLKLSCYIPQLKKADRVQKTETLLPLRRGLFSLKEHLILRTGFPFIFTERIITTSINKNIIIYPGLMEVDISQIIPETGTEMGSTDKEEFQMVRKYQYGDDMRLIHWRATAKTGEVMVKEFKIHETSKITIIFDNYRPPDPQAFEKTISFAASVCAKFIEGGYSVRFITCQKIIPFGTGKEHLFKILDHLACLSPVERGFAPFKPRKNKISFSISGEHEGLCPSLLCIDEHELIGQNSLLILQSEISPFIRFKASAGKTYYATEI